MGKPTLDGTVRVAGARAMSVPEPAAIERYGAVSSASEKPPVTRIASLADEP
jgi:hypothetical protein